ncbi:hypothetical protein AVEN_172745-1 [Araneus ventricosus]|uniref:Uncharacterized protein n=1 Tax=Araneus ventricosus TaxID=182803 RepID=A0A4Y2BHU6_ARAVE|nr:hypothetical protein AVEN_172745-1 [Araneus ventricosus]
MIRVSSLHARRWGFNICRNSLSRIVPEKHTQYTTAYRNCTEVSVRRLLPLMSDHLPTFLWNIRATPQILAQLRLFAVPRREIRRALSKERQNRGHGKRDICTSYAPPPPLYTSTLQKRHQYL